jgi:hypothetical protein
MPRTYYDARPSQCLFCKLPTWYGISYDELPKLLDNIQWCCEEQQANAIEQLQELLKDFWIGRVTNLQSSPTQPTYLSGNLR